MPLLDHFHPPLHGPRRWEGFHHSWATVIAQHREANLHAEIFDVLEIKARRAVWSSPSGLYAVAYRAVPVRKSPRLEAWPEPLAIGQPLPVLPLWLSLDLFLPLRLEDSYLATCQSLRISA